MTRGRDALRPLRSREAWVAAPRRSLLGASLGVALVAALTWPLTTIDALRDRNGAVALVLLLAVLVAAGVGRIVAGLVTAVAAALADIWYFSPPLHALHLDGVGPTLGIAAFALAATATSALVG